MIGIFKKAIAQKVEIDAKKYFAEMDEMFGNLGGCNIMKKLDILPLIKYGYEVDATSRLIKFCKGTKVHSVFGFIELETNKIHFHPLATDDDKANINKWVDWMCDNRGTELLLTKDELNTIGQLVRLAIADAKSSLREFPNMVGYIKKDIKNYENIIEIIGGKE